MFVFGDGVKFEGQWINDKKHGMGILTYKDGEVIKGFWQNDRLNGLAEMKPAGAKKAMTVIYKNDMMIMENDSGVSCRDICYCISSIIICLTFYSAIPLGIMINRNFFYIFLVWLIYIVISAMHPSSEYVKNLTPLDHKFKNI